MSNQAPQAYPPNWYAATRSPAPDRAALASHEQVDVAIVGAGFAGLHLARLLLARTLYAHSQAGVRPVERTIAGGAVGRAMTQAAYWWMQARDQWDEAGSPRPAAALRHM